jgi:wyosine [tRNA(Phe)-imidazoG37] synthetase (radical SAM superfamily)
MPLRPLPHIVYGPIHSRRLGRSLGVNLLPAGIKVCNMNCAYCQYGWSPRGIRFRGEGVGWPTPQAVESAVTTRLTRAAESGEILDRITVAGHGEPTLHPDFEEMAARLCAVRDRVAPGLPLAILSNSTTAGSAEVRKGLDRFDERYMKLDAGDAITYARINGAGVPIARIVDGLRALAPVTVQAMFVTDVVGTIDNTTEGAVHDWVGALQEARADRVHVYTIDRPPAATCLRPVATSRLREIAEHARAAGIAAQVFAGRGRERSRASGRFDRTARPPGYQR